MDPDEFVRWRQDLDNLELLPGYQIEMELRHMDLSWQLYSINYVELEKNLAVFCDPVKSSKLWNLENRDKLSLASLQITRLLFNMLSSATMLVDHTRVKVNSMYQGGDFSREYSAEVEKRFRHNEVHRFIQGLRNFFTHRELPFARASFRYKRDEGVSTSISLRKEQLETWDGWTKEARDYLSRVDDENIELLGLIREYGETIRDFHSWLRKRQLTVHKEDLRELSARRKELRDRKDELDKGNA